jgi:hypothetical protein
MDPRFNSWHAWFETEVSASECRQAQHRRMGWEWSTPQTTIKNNKETDRFVLEFREEVRRCSL